MVKDMASYLPSAEDVIRALGVHTRRTSGSEVLPGLALFGAGILVGAGLALLFAPSTGHDLREEIGERVNHLRDRVTGNGESDSEVSSTRANA